MVHRPARACLTILALGLVATGIPALVSANQHTLAPGEDLVGRTIHVKARQSDTLSDLARTHGAGYEEIVMANRAVDPWLPGEGTKVLIPDRHVLPNAPRQGIVMNVAELRLYYFPPTRAGEPRTVVTYPVSVGRVDWRTPLGTTKVVRKQLDPTWTPPASIKREHALEGDILPDVIAAGDDNPLGRHALYLGVQGYLIHGTNKPYGIGMRVTHGCVRLYPEDIELLFQQVPVGTPVHLVDQPYKAGWSDGALYLEAHPPFGEGLDGEVNRLADMVQVVMDATRAYPDYPVDWKRAEAEVLTPTGVPVPIGPRLPPHQRPRAADTTDGIAPGGSVPATSQATAAPPRPPPARAASTASPAASKPASAKTTPATSKPTAAKASPAASSPTKPVTQTAKKETPPQRGSQSAPVAR
jgi:L,D-transpeptidase ErfK/SrfK